MSVLRRMSDIMVRSSARLTKWQMIRISDAKVNLGSALQIASGWVNVDCNVHTLLRPAPRPLLNIVYRLSAQDQWMLSPQNPEHLSADGYADLLKNNIFVHHDMRYGLPFPDNSVRYVYSSHFMEHLFREDAEKLIADVYRILVSGGIVRTCVPDLAYVVSVYERGNKEEFLSYFFSSRARYMQRHRYMYDFKLLADLLESHGFTDIQRCAFQEGRVPDIQRLDCKPWETLYVEAMKP